MLTLYSHYGSCDFDHKKASPTSQACYFVYLEISVLLHRCQILTNIDMILLFVAAIGISLMQLQNGMFQMLLEIRRCMQMWHSNMDKDKELALM